MILDILPLAGGTARLVRVYGGEPCVKLPGAVPAPEGEGQWPITELGDYCFSEKPRGLPGPEKICRYERAEDGKLCLTRAFGRDVSGKERYSFDFDAPAAPAQDDELHPICGNFLEEVTLPDSLRVIGSCTFYNCRRLRRLTAGTGELTMGSDVFLNCFALEDLVIRATPEQATGLFALVGSITEAVRALNKTKYITTQPYKINNKRLRDPNLFLFSFIPFPAFFPQSIFEKYSGYSRFHSFCFYISYNTF